MSSSPAWALWLVLWLCCGTGAPGSLQLDLDVPAYALVSGTANLGCAYDISDTKLYSLKWYHNNTEFYRYVPTERNGPVNIGPTDIFLLHELSRDSRHVTLSLSRLTAAATGTYKCEVLAEHPSFRTKSAQAFMTVLDSRLAPPKIRGVKLLYEPSDTIAVTCHSDVHEGTNTESKLSWLIDGIEVGQPLVTEQSTERGGEVLGLTLPARQVVESGGSVQVECRVTRGPLRDSSVKTLRVRMRDYVFSISAAPGGNPPKTILWLSTVFLRLSAHLRRS